MAKVYEIDVTYYHRGIEVEANSDEEAIGNACAIAWQLDAYDTAIKIIKAYDPEAAPSYKIGDHFTGPGGELIVYGIYNKVVFYEEVGNPSMEGTMVDRMQFEADIRSGRIYGQREETLLEKAMRLIDSFSCVQFQTRGDFTDLSCVPIGHTTVTDHELPVQVNTDLIAWKVERYISDVLVDLRQYSSLEELVMYELSCLDFDELVSFTDEEIESATEADGPITMDTHGMYIDGTCGPWRVIDHTAVHGKTFWLMESEIEPCKNKIIVDNNGMLCIRNAYGCFSHKNLQLLEWETKPVAKMPDAFISIADMKNYGYLFGGMLPLLQDTAQNLYAENVCIYRLYDDNTEGMVESSEEIEAHALNGGIFGVEKDDWTAYLNRKQED